MNPNSRQLAARDLALCAALGIVGAPGSDFGSDYSGGDEYDPGYNPEQSDPSQSVFAGDFGVDFGGDFGADATAMAVTGAAPSPTPANMQKAWSHYQTSLAGAAISKKREMILDPNKGASTKIERYMFSANQNLVLGTAVALSFQNNPDTTIRPQRVSMNAPTYGFATISELKVSNVSVTVGGTADAYDFNANGVGQHLDMPTISPANKVSVLGNYTGFVPPGFVGATAYVFVATFKGPAQLAG